MKIDESAPPDTDLAGMAPEEKALFMQVIHSSICALHTTNPIQQAINMEAFFASCCRQSIFYAGLYVQEYRRMKGMKFDLE
jgi:hypothetical protein